MSDSETLKHDDRIQHADKGLGTIVAAPDQDIEVPNNLNHGPDTVMVKWDDDRFPVEAVARAELEKVPDAAAAISTGM